MDLPRDLPSFDDLPVRDGTPGPSTWGLWGEADRLGCLNLLTPERAVRAATCVRKGAVFALDWELDLPDPPLFGRPAPEHTVIGQAGRGHDDVVHFNPQSSSQWDGFRHVGVAGHHYNGLSSEEHGVDYWGRKGLVGRGVLADVGRWRAGRGDPLDLRSDVPVSADELTAVLADQGTTVEPGDVLLIRFGWTEWYLGLDASEREAVATTRPWQHMGISAGEAMVRTLWSMQVAAIGSDVPALEIMPFGTGLSEAEREGPYADLHHVLLPLLGVPIGELWDLRALAADCADDGAYEFLFTSAPLHMPKGVASPPNALAIK